MLVLDGGGRVLFRIPAAKSVWATFGKPTWTVETFRVVYRHGTSLLMLLLPLLAGMWELPQHCWEEEEEAGNNLLHRFWPWSRARLSSACLGCLLSCPLAFHSRKYCVWNSSDRNLSKLFSKNIRQKDLIISPCDLLQCWATCAVRKLFLPHLLNFHCEPVMLNPFTSWPGE